MDNDEFVGYLLFLVIVFILGCWGGCSTGTFSVKYDAIKAGVAEYTVNRTNGVTDFVFLGPKVESSTNK